MMNRFYAEISGKNQFTANKPTLFNLSVGAIAIYRIPTRWSVSAKPSYKTLIR